MGELWGRAIGNECSGDFGSVIAFAGLMAKKGDGVAWAWN